MLRKQFNGVLSVFVVILCVTSIRCDVSHLIAAESSVDAGTVEVLKQNITDYLVQLASGGGPQMQLQHIYSASKQIVTGTLYTVQAQLTTPEGLKNCEVRVLEKPWIEFCQVRVSCEHGGQYEVLIDPHHTSHGISHDFSALNFLPPPTASPAPIFQFQQPVTIRQNPFFNQFQTIQAVTPQVPFTTLPKFEVKPPTQFQFTPQPPKTPVFDFKPQAPAKFEFKQPASIFDYKPQIAAKVDVKPPALQFTAPTAPVFKPQAPPKFEFKPPAPLPALPALPAAPVAPILKPQAPPKFEFKPQAPLPALPAAPVFQPQAPQKSPAFNQLSIKSDVPTGQLNVLSLDKLPKGAALEGYFRQLFHDFMVKYGRTYIGDENEEEYRFNIFVKNFYAMQEQSQTERSSAKYSVTQFSDFTENEVNNMKGIFPRWNFLNSTDVPGAEVPKVGKNVPEKYDQRDENLVTRVKTQQSCSACWAFVTVAVIEGLCAKKTKTLQEFSEQSLIDCDGSNYACNGGVPPNAMRHIARRGGLELESIYGYKAAKSTCRFQKKNVRVKINGPFGIHKEEEIAKWLVNHGPVAVNINAKRFNYYTGGVMDPSPQDCSPSQSKLDHGVTIIGYGVEESNGKKIPYWIAKNSWGPSWGEGGFFRIARGKNACGIVSSAATTAILANDPNNCLLNGA